MNRHLFATTPLPPDELSYLRAGVEWYIHDIYANTVGNRRDRYLAATRRALFDIKSSAYRRCVDARPSGRIFSTVLQLNQWSDVRTYLDEMGFNAQPRTPNPESHA